MRKKMSPYCCSARTMRQKTSKAGAGVKLRAWMKQMMGGITPSRAPTEVGGRKSETENESGRESKRESKIKSKKVREKAKESKRESTS